LCEEQGFIINGKERYLKFLNEVGRDIGVVADVGNIMFVDEKAADFFPLVKDKICHAHVKDFKIVDEGLYKTRGGNQLTDASLGCGDADVKSALEYLKESGYEGYISLECMMVDESDEKTLLDNINYVKECMK
jgi:sugar phosphate isomerase/epimerase